MSKTGPRNRNRRPHSMVVNKDVKTTPNSPELAQRPVLDEIYRRSEPIEPLILPEPSVTISNMRYIAGYEPNENLTEYPYLRMGLRLGIVLAGVGTPLVCMAISASRHATSWFEGSAAALLFVGLPSLTLSVTLEDESMISLISRFKGKHHLTP